MLEFWNHRVGKHSRNDAPRSMGSDPHPSNHDVDRSG